MADVILDGVRVNPDALRILREKAAKRVYDVQRPLLSVGLLVSSANQHNNIARLVERAESEGK